MHDLLLPPEVESELLPFVSDQPTSKEAIIEQMKERSWMHQSFKSVINFLFGVPIRRFYRGKDGHVYFDRFSIE